MICGGRQQPCAAISVYQCLDHQATKGEGGQPLPAVVTNKVYTFSVIGHVERKRKVLDVWAVEPRRIIGATAVVGLPVAA
jgi:hypothetical protein